MLRCEDDIKVYLKILKWSVRVWTSFGSIRLGHSGECFEKVIMPSGPIKTGNFFESLSDCDLSRRNCCMNLLN